MKLRVALTTVLVVPSALALVGPAGPAHAVAVCQGQPATIEGATGTITGTEGNDVIVSSGADTIVNALSGNDLVCAVGGQVNTGLGDDSVVSTGAVGTFTNAYLVGGTDTYVGGAGGSDVIVDEITSFHVTFGATGDARATLELFPTSTPGTGTVDFGVSSGFLYAFGEEQSRVNLAAQTASVDGLLHVTTTGLHDATATGCKVRMKGDSEDNVLTAYGHDIVSSGGGGRDRIGRIGNGFDLELPECGRYKSVFRGQAGPDRLFGRAGGDVLIGGTGHDVANGAGGVDTCRTEVRKNCEK
jgi:RTX calcium-binding nonapeptide repeat (4 copies)